MPTCVGAAAALASSVHARGDDVLKVATFWAAVLGRPLDKGSGEVFASIGGSDAARREPALYFNKVPEPKRAKNRVHLDVRVAGREVRGEARKRLVSEHVERLVQAGASLAWRTDDVRGTSVTLYDPEGNEFCVH